MQITIIGQRHTFIELAKAIKDSLVVKGYDAKSIKIVNHVRRFLENDLTFQIPYDDDLNVVIFAQKLPNERILPKNNSIKICIATEQQKNRLGIYQGWDKVLQFFPDWITQPNEIYFPLGYSERFIDKSSLSVPRLNLLSFGANTPVRVQLCKQLGIEHVKGIFTEKRGSYITSAKINVNVPARAEYHFAPLHALLVICQGKLLFQFLWNKPDLLYKSYFIDVNKDNFHKKKKYWLENRAERLQFGLDARERLKKELIFSEQFLHCLKGVI